MAISKEISSVNKLPRKIRFQLRFKGGPRKILGKTTPFSGLPREFLVERLTGNSLGSPSKTILQPARHFQTDARRLRADSAQCLIFASISSSLRLVFSLSRLCFASSSLRFVSSSHRLVFASSRLLFASSSLRLALSSPHRLFVSSCLHPVSFFVSVSPRVVFSSSRLLFLTPCILTRPSASETGMKTLPAHGRIKARSKCHHTLTPRAPRTNRPIPPLGFLVTVGFPGVTQSPPFRGYNFYN